jgi:diguanylate cyclase (GGDEF)-like protein
MVDVDNFKAFNDTYGHLAGDDVLRALSRIVSHCARATDVVGRFGGEEFLVVLPDTSVENAVILAERLRQEVERHGHERLRPFSNQLPTVSIGVCAAGPRDDTYAAIARCDRALYESKHRGRNCFSLGLPDEEMP